MGRLPDLPTGVLQFFQGTCHYKPLDASSISPGVSSLWLSFLPLVQLMPLSFKRFLINYVWHFESLRLVIGRLFCQTQAVLRRISSQLDYSAQIPGFSRSLELPNFFLYLKLLQGRQAPLRNQILPEKAVSGVLPTSWWEEVGEFSKLRFLAGGPWTFWGACKWAWESSWNSSNCAQKFPGKLLGEEVLKFSLDSQ